MRAHLVVPLAKGGRLLGSLSVSDDAPREWTRYDLAIVEETAERTWAAVERANVEATLKTREAQLAFLDEISQLMAVAAPESQILNRHQRANRRAPWPDPLHVPRRRQRARSGDDDVRLAGKSSRRGQCLGPIAWPTT